MNQMRMKPLRLLSAASAALLVLATLACSDDKKPTAPEITEPPEMVTETFRGSVPQKSETCHFYTLGAGGSITTEIKDLQPLISITMGLAIGVPSESASEGCARVVTDDSARVFEVFLSANNPPGDYCICIFDVGNIFPGESISYVLDVEHPL